MISLTNADSNTSFASFSVHGRSVVSPKRARTSGIHNETFSKSHIVSTTIRSSVALNDFAASTPSQYLVSTLQNMGVSETRRDLFSIAAAMYFLPYTECDSIDLDVLKAVRTHDKATLLKLISNHTNCLEQRNRFGESLAHLVTRWGDADMMNFLLSKRLPLNVRDCHGRTPLHNACMSIRPNMELMAAIVSRAPELLLYPDDSGSLPLDWVRANAHADCIQLLACTQLTWARKLASSNHSE